MHIYAIRHGQSANNALDIASPDEYMRARHHDPELTATGRAQAEALARHLGAGSLGDARPLGRLYSSPMLRALETTRPIAAALGLTPHIWPDLHELGGLFQEAEDGAVTGYASPSRAALAAAYPGWALPESLGEGGWWSAAQGRESHGAILARVTRVAAALREMAAGGDGTAIALVSHGGFLDLLVRALLGQGLPVDEDYRMIYMHYNTGLSLITLDAAGAGRLVFLNRLDHLPGGQITF